MASNLKFKNHFEFAIQQKNNNNLISGISGIRDNKWKTMSN